MADFAVRPDSASGRFSKKFDDAIGGSPNTSDLYQVSLGRKLRHDATIIWDQIPTIPPHEALLAEIESSTAPVVELDKALAANELPDIYTEHPAMVGSPPGTRIHPVSLYIDGVAYLRLDSCLGIWCYFALTKKRKL